VVDTPGSDVLGRVTWPSSSPNTTEIFIVYSSGSGSEPSKMLFFVLIISNLTWKLAVEVVSTVTSVLEESLGNVILDESPLNNVAWYEISIESLSTASLYGYL